MVIKGSYPILGIDDCIDSQKNTKLFLTLDAHVGYWQVEIDRSKKKKTAHVTSYGLYRDMRVPFGLESAPATFQSALNVRLLPVKWQTAVLHFGKVVLFRNDNRQHIIQVQQVSRLMK